ncbi:MAG TPA: hypothetical protein VFQ23_02890 [Anaerolineales bacterium]|nr:hypothetical protein [Anaerolineales bacterium]
MENSAEAMAVRFHDVEFSPQGITLLSQQSKLLYLAKQDIRKITLKKGFQAERPIAEILFGIFVIGLGLYFFANFVLEALIHRTIYLDDLLSLFLLPIGGWFIVDGLRKRLYFEVVLDRDTRKFPLGKNPDKGELGKFIRIATQLGYVIDARFLDQVD